ncbi:hypothetical protein COV93_02970 [Candidatus Woesearchaeota archaeon CG11_big_fil_rev_8_21_14_0_20_43_8]|nr:MAG: hypothetical protein COV93_02970 [Candidatus Woesearchaeota archaeon CG11_big_fil_rev_8_21_14_0_20_43_8]
MTSSDNDPINPSKNLSVRTVLLPMKSEVDKMLRDHLETKSWIGMMDKIFKKRLLYDESNTFAAFEMLSKLLDNILDSGVYRIGRLRQLHKDIFKIYNNEQSYYHGHLDLRDEYIKKISGGNPDAKALKSYNDYITHYEVVRIPVIGRLMKHAEELMRLVIK